MFFTSAPLLSAEQSGKNRPVFGLQDFPRHRGRSWSRLGEGPDATFRPPEELLCLMDDDPASSFFTSFISLSFRPSAT